MTLIRDWVVVWASRDERMPLQGAGIELLGVLSEPFEGAADKGVGIARCIRLFTAPRF